MDADAEVEPGPKRNRWLAVDAEEAAEQAAKQQLLEQVTFLWGQLTGLFVCLSAWVFAVASSSQGQPPQACCKITITGRLPAACCLLPRMFHCMGHKQAMHRQSDLLHVMQVQREEAELAALNAKEAAELAAATPAADLDAEENAEEDEAGPARCDQHAYTAAAMWTSTSASPASQRAPTASCSSAPGFNCWRLGLSAHQTHAEDEAAQRAAISILHCCHNVDEYELVSCISEGT